MNRRPGDAPRPRTPAALMLSAAVLAACFAGCRSGETAGGGRAELGAADASLPAYEDVVAAYNARVSAFGRVWARVTAVYRGVDDAGNRLSEQAEGHLQIDRPDRVALSLGKLGETYLYLGSNESRYWWIDLVDADRKVALTGTHAEATPARIRALGLPVRPPELVEVVGIVPLPVRGGVVERDTRPGAPPGGFMVTAPRGGGAGDGGPGGGADSGPSGGPIGGLVRLWFAPEDDDAAGFRGEPTRVALLDAAGAEVLHATLGAYQRFGGVDRPRSHRLPRRVRLESDRFEGWARLTMYDPERRSINPLVFDPDGLFARLGVDEVIDLDERLERAVSASDGPAGGAVR